MVLSFNGWLFEGYEDAKTGLMGTILEELLSHRNFLRKATVARKSSVSGFEKFCLRACINHRTTDADIDDITTEVLSAAGDLL